MTLKLSVYFLLNNNCLSGEGVPIPGLFLPQEKVKVASYTWFLSTPFLTLIQKNHLERVFYLQSSTRGYKSIHTATLVRCGLCLSLCTQTVEGSDLVKHICSSESNYCQMSCLLNNFSKHFFLKMLPLLSYFPVDSETQPRKNRVISWISLGPWTISSYQASGRISGCTVNIC